MDRGNFFLKKKRFDTRRLVIFALFCAFAYVVTFVFHIKVAFLTFDAKDCVICMAAMLFGPLPAVVISLVVSLLEMVTVSETGFWGFVMNFVSTSAFAAAAGGFYHHFRKMWSAIVGLLLGAAAQVSVMLLLNPLIIPIYMNASREEVVQAIPVLLLPFNLIKAVLNASLVLALYKPLSSALKKARVIPSGGEEDHPFSFRGRSAVILISGLAVALACVLIFLFVMDGNIGFLK